MCANYIVLPTLYSTAYCFPIVVIIGDSQAKSYTVVSENNRFNKLTIQTVAFYLYSGQFCY